MEFVNNFKDIFSLRDLIIFFGRYYKSHSEQVKHRTTKATHNQTSHQVGDSPKLRKSPTSTENSSLEYIQLFDLAKTQHQDYLPKIVPYVIAASMMNEQWNYAGMVLWETVEIIFEMDKAERLEREMDEHNDGNLLKSHLDEYNDVSSFGDNFGHSISMLEENKDIMKSLLESNLRLILRKIRQNMLKLSAYTCQCADTSQVFHVTSNETIYKETVDSILDALCLGLDVIHVATTEFDQRSNGEGTISVQTSLELDDALCSMLYSMIHSFLFFIDRSQYRKLQEKFRKRVTAKMHITVSEYLESKYVTYNERVKLEGDRDLQFRMEYNFGVDKDGNVKPTNVGTAFVNPNAIPSTNTLILNKLQQADNHFKVVIEGRSPKEEHGRSHPQTQDLSDYSWEQNQIVKESVTNQHLFMDQEEDGVNDRDFW